MAEHVHGCLNCRPDMVPDFSRDDPRYHDYHKCGVAFTATVDGIAAGYTHGVFEGPEGWALVCAADSNIESVHDCPPCSGPLPDDGSGYPGYQHSICLTPAFGVIVVTHGCPADLAAQVERLKEALKPLMPEAMFWRAVFGRDVY
jgi:hypothetical protein